MIHVLREKQPGDLYVCRSLMYKYLAFVGARLLGKLLWSFLVVKHSVTLTFGYMDDRILFF